MLDLSQQQKAAVQYVKGPLLLLARAGGGKTSLLVHKIVWLIREYGIDPAAIVALTINSHTSRIIQRRVEELLREKVPTLTAVTFAEFSLRLLQERLSAVGMQTGFSLYDRLEGECLVARILRDIDPPVAAATPAAVARHISAWKRTGTAPPAPTTVPGSCPESVAAWVYPRYQQRLRTANAIDLDDLSRKAVELLDTDAAIGRALAQRTRFLLVDEYEQTSVCEHELVRRLAASGPILTAAGDDIRALLEPGPVPADNLTRLQAEVPNIRVMKIEQNFRCTTRILRAIARLATSPLETPPASLRNATRLGARLRVLQTRSEQHEAESIVAMLADHRARHGIDYRHYAILLRQSEQMASLERALQVHRVPYHTRGNLPFFAHSEVRDLWAYLKLLCNPCDDNAFLRAINTPRRDIDHTTLQRLAAFAAERVRPLFECALTPEFTRTLAPEKLMALQAVTTLLRGLNARARHTDPVQLACDLVADLRYGDWLHDTCNDANIAARRMENVTQLIGALRRIAGQQPDADLRSLITQLNLRAVLDGDADDNFEGVALMPLTVAHGLEFDHVYLVGFEDGMTSSTATTGAAATADERYWTYVAMTRGRESITFAITERRRGSMAMPGAAHRFLTELGQDLEWVSAKPGHPFAENTLLNPRSWLTDVPRYSR